MTMLINRLRVNHIENPVGFLLNEISFSWIVESAAGTRTAAAEVSIALDEAMRQTVFTSGRRGDICGADYSPDFSPQPGTRYYWRVRIWDDAGDCGESETAFFEAAAEMEKASWIQSPFSADVQPIFRREVTIAKEVASARLYICGLGLYEAYLNGEKIGDEYLTPYYNDYNLWLQYQTYDITTFLRPGANCLGVMLGNGWYKGRFGFVDKMDCLYGDTCRLIAELHIRYADGTADIIPTDTEWLSAPSPVIESSIYDGEVWDSRKEIPHWAESGCGTAEFERAVISHAPTAPLTARLSLPVCIQEKIKPARLIRTGAGECVLDFAQEVTGWVEFTCSEPNGKEILLQYGEILQNGNFYNENLRTAKAEYRFISAGKPAYVRPHFTFYGFRYVKVQGISNIDPDDFTACVLYSKMDKTGTIETSNPKVNRLILNALWGQKGNFLDTPTDCPQRDERMGWTGDAQVFSATACFNMYAPAFYKKFLYDMKLEQNTLGGSVPHTVPDVLGQIDRILHKNDKPSENIAVSTNHGSCAWADVATVIPWNVYMAYGDRTMLRSQYENMKSWVDYVRRVDKTRCGGKYLWTDGFHFADWLALDNFHKDSCFGATDPYFVASAYYYYSASLTAKAAEALGKNEDAAYYSGLAGRIKEAFIDEFYTRTGRLAQQTQTALALVLWLDLIPAGARQRQIDALIKNLDEENTHLTTGFVGTPLLCPALCASGHADRAYTLLLNEDYPGWLYEVNMGATTVWERWNSVLSDGRVSDTGMNSLNHYAYGSIVEWMVKYMCGLNAAEPGYKRFTVKPYTDGRLDFAHLSYASAYGTIRAGWERRNGSIVYTLRVPFDTEAEFIPPEGTKDLIINGKPRAGSEPAVLTPGEYEISINQ
jgi:alpha-L-rhamnosidase